mmetsp:Transcript_40310/g.133427  ORF Transcript_40310/g.133427 Transcript_40310/m.133427 type:complete len:235 (+) Transcript_40310:712-1416(+)
MHTSTRHGASRGCCRSRMRRTRSRRCARGSACSPFGTRSAGTPPLALCRLPRACPSCGRSGSDRAAEGCRPPRRRARGSPSRGARCCWRTPPSPSAPICSCFRLRPRARATSRCRCRCTVAAVRRVSGSPSRRARGCAAASGTASQSDSGRCLATSAAGPSCHGASGYAAPRCWPCGTRSLCTPLSTRPGMRPAGCTSTTASRRACPPPSTSTSKAAVCWRRREPGRLPRQRVS